MPWGAAIGGGLFGAVGSILSSRTQANAARDASDVQQQMFNRTRADLAPWMQGGQLALGELETLLGLGGPGMPSNVGGAAPGGGPNIGGTMDITNAGRFTMPPGPRFGADIPAGPTGGNPNDPNFGLLTRPFGLDQFQASPAYQFNLQEGQKAIDKAAAARGNFYAPATLQDTARFSQGLASNEFQNAFSNYQTNMGNIWNRLYSLSSGGQNAAARLGGFGTTVGSELGSNIIGAGNAQAAGQMGVFNAVGGAFNQAGNNALIQQILSQQQQSSIPQEMVPGQYSTLNPQYG